MQNIIVMSHLRWNFVHQRPQHLLSRLAAHYRIHFFEEPVFHPKKHLAAISEPHPNVMVWTPYTPVEAHGFHDDQLRYLQPLMRQLGLDYPKHMVWFYTPLALPLMDELNPALVIYDCMDELAAFKNSPKQLLQRENALFKVANVVFTGGGRVSSGQSASAIQTFTVSLAAWIPPTLPRHRTGQIASCARSYIPASPGILRGNR